MSRWVAALLLAASTLMAVPAWGADPSVRYWRAIASSNLIVTGQISVPPEIQGKPADYISLRIQLDRTLKGDPGGREIAVRYFPSEASYAVPYKRLLSLDKQRVIVFLESGRVEYKTDWYFVAFSGVEPENGQATAEIQAEVTRQENVLRDWKPGPRSKYTGTVKRLINQTTKAKEEEKAFRDLEDLGMAAVPDMIDMMDDRRPLPNPGITLRNPPGAFEGVRYYGPKQVVDALAAILNQVAGYSFGFIYSGGSDQERDHSVAGWRIYSDILRNHPTVIPH
jgi:hypothetical protein